MPSLDDIMAEIIGGGAKPVVVAGGRIKSEDYRVTIDKEVQAMELAEFARGYRQRFQVGQYITPKPNTGTKGAGLPHLVVEVNPNAEPVFLQDGNGSMRNGRRNEIRVATYVDDETITMFWVEAVDYEPWTGPTEV